MSSFATLADVTLLSGRTFTSAEQERIVALLPLVSDALRYEAVKVGKDLDEMMSDSSSYASVVKLVTVDVVMRAFNQPNDSEPMAQMSQSALGYTISGTYAIPGGGIANSIMKNDLKRLGLRKQQIGVVSLWSPCSEE